ncbi:AAA family ATPase [Pirellulales bacterium]|nr:AAA family ATPase [Pirellulales bacterium]
MLNFIEFTDVGPSESMQLHFAPRINVLTGDNGLGKTFVLENAWWSLTRTWTSSFAKPYASKGKHPQVSFGIGEWVADCKYDHKKNNWITPRKTSKHNGIVVFARADSGVSVWDPTRTSALNFDLSDLYNGIRRKPNVLCEGLLSDWVMWQERENESFRFLARALETLSPCDEEKMRPGRPVRTSVDDVREVPTLELSYGSVPLTHASAGMKRVVALAYLLVWATMEYRTASELLGEEPSDSMVVLFDEVEAHLHPQWQRVFLPALLEVTRHLLNSDLVQFITTTHAPLVLASIEPCFSPDKDRVFTFDLTNGVVVPTTRPWAKQGDATNWLVSESFGLEQARSRDAEIAIEAAEAFMRDEIRALPAGLKSKDEIHKELLRVLPGHDHFWPRWIVKTQQIDDGPEPDD